MIYAALSTHSLIFYTRRYNYPWFHGLNILLFLCKRLAKLEIANIMINDKFDNFHLPNSSLSYRISI